MRVAAVLLVVACAHRPAAPTDAFERILSVEHAHDAEALRTLRDGPDAKALRDDDKGRRRLADVTRLTLGLWEARDDYEASNGYAALAKLFTGPTRFEGAPRSELPLLPKVPIPVIMMSVDGKPPAAFIVDTGAAGLALNKAYCDRVGLPYLKDHPRTTHDAAGNPVPLMPMHVTTLSMQELTVRDVEAVVIDLPPNFQIGGILSPQRVFAGALIELDLRDRVLRVDRTLSAGQWEAAAAEPVARAALTWDDGNVYVRAKLGTLEGWMNFDTGAVDSFTTTGFAPQLGLTLDPSKTVDALSVTHHKSYPPVPLDLSVGGGAPRNALVAIIEKAPTHEALDGPVLGNVGESWMAGRRLVVTPDGRTLLYTAASAP